MLTQLFIDTFVGETELNAIGRFGATLERASKYSIVVDR